MLGQDGLICQLKKTNIMKLKLLLPGILLLIYTCNSEEIQKDDNTNAVSVIENKDTCLRAGFRFSSYGIEYDAGTDYWIETAIEISNKFSHASPASIWIVGVLSDSGTYLNFPVETTNPLIKYSAVDKNEEILNRFDENGFKIWLQVEPGNASVEELIPLVLNKYKHHTCIIGFGVDVEWYKSVDQPDGEVVTDEIARRWLTTIQEIDPDYKLFLKHWLIEKMPKTERTDIVFIDDSQMFESMNQMVTEFEVWGNHFAPAKVGFQFGYEADKKWWDKFNDPVSTISEDILKRIPNTRGLYWVDFTLFDVFPPDQKQ